MDIVNLKKTVLLGKGGERNCYLHPNDNEKVIKINHIKGINNNQNELEYKYYEFLEKNKIDFNKITKCFGWIDTNYGKGLIFERIKNYDNSDVRTFSFYVKHNIFEKNYDLDLIKELKEYIFKNELLFIDASLSNIFCKKIARNKYTLIIIDGLGARRTGIKFWLYLKFKIFRIYKIKKQWKKFERNYYYERNLNLLLNNEKEIEY